MAVAVAAAFAACATAPARAEHVVTFDDLTLDPNSNWHGPAPSGVDVPDPWGAPLPMRVGTFESGGVAFSNSYNPNYSYLGVAAWEGFAYSNTADTTSPSYANQFSAITGTGRGPGADNYGVVTGYVDLVDPYTGVVFDPTDPAHLEKLPYFELPEFGEILGMHVTNTTLTYMSMLHGDGWAKAFGGPTGTDPDWFKLTAYGVDAAGQALTDSVEFYLADYRSADKFLLTDWAYVDLTPLAGAQRIYFNMSSSDITADGMATPAFFAVDDIRYEIIPEPSSLALLGLGAGALGLLARRRRPAA